MLGEVLDTAVRRLRETGALCEQEPTTGAPVFKHARSAQACNSRPVIKILPPLGLHLTPATAEARSRLHKQLKGVEQKMLAHKQARLEVARTKPWRLSKQSSLIDTVLTELLSGQELLYNVMAVPIAQTVWEASPRDIRSPEPPGEEPTGVDFVLLDMTGKTNSDLVTQVSDWLEAQIFSLVEVAERGPDDTKDVVPLTLTESREGTTLAVSEPYLQHLEKQCQAASLSKPAPGCQLVSGDAMLHWLGRWQTASPHTTLPGSKKDAVLPAYNHKQMVKSQKEVVSLASRTSQIQELINLMKEDVNEACNLTTHRDSRFRHHQRLPPTHMESILEQELHVCKANVCCVGYKMYLGSTRLFRLGQRLNQAEAQYKHLQIVKEAIQRYGMPLVMEDPNSSDHQRAHVGHAMLHEHEMNEKAMKDLWTAMQVINDQRDVAESDHAKLTRELEKVKGWGDQIAELVSALEDLSEYFEKYAASRPPGLGVSLPEQSLRELSDHFHDDLQAKLCTSETQATVLKMLETQHTLMLRQLDEDRAVVELMWSHVSRPARDDPALHILPLLVAPLVQDRLEAMASDHTAGPSVSSEERLGSTPSWDPRWGMVARQYKQNICTGCPASIDANSLLLQQQMDRLAHMYEDKNKDSSKDMYMTFVDDLLLGQCKPPSSESNALEGTILGDMDAASACLAALLFMS
ncbi:hypothetical protein ABBQ38_001705 [Trebouxia sp. C0009 RCD-2024]